MPKQLRFSVDCSEESKDSVKCKVDISEDNKSAACTVELHDKSLSISCTGDKELLEQMKNG